jgi:hypothetical protein
VGALKLNLGAGKKTIEVLEEHVVLGRDASAQVVVKDRSVSRKHAVIERRGERWFVVDQNSSNGTYLDGKRVTEAPLANGQELRLGTVALGIEIEAPKGDATVLLNVGAPRAETATMLVAPPASAKAAPASRKAPTAAPAAQPATSAPVAQTTPVDRAAAAERLGVARGASLDQVRRRHDELAKKAQERLTAAATPQLRTHCQRQLDELRAARDVLLSAPKAAEASAAPVALTYDPDDLPSAQPVVVDEALQSVIFKPGMLGAAPESASPQHADTAMHPMTKFFGSSGIVLIALCLFFMIGRGKDRGLIDKFQHQADFATARQNAELYRTTAVLVDGGAITNRQLTVCNAAAEPMRVTWLGALFVEATQEDPKDPESARLYKPRKFHSGYCAGAFNVVIAPGAQRTFSFAGSDERCQWQGAAAYFGLSTVPAAKANAEDVRSLWYAGVPGGEGACVKIGAQK